MNGYKEPSHQDRMAIAQGARVKALAQLRGRPQVDPAELARRIALQDARDETQRMKRLAAQGAREAAQAAREADRNARREQDRLAAEAALALQPRVPTEAELKAARDLRYAERKARNNGRS